jgi:hypothetical protein
MKNGVSWKDEIKNLKADNSTGKYIETNSRENYKIRVVRRGEGIFYQDGDRALICPTDPFLPIISVSKASRWDDGERPTEEEISKMKERIIKYFQKYQGSPDVKII